MERIFAKGADIIEGIAKKAVGFADDVLQSLDKLISLIKKGSQSFASFIRQVLDDFFEWLKGLFKSGKADELTGMAEDIFSGIRMSVEEFETGLKNLLFIKPENALNHIDQALIYFNHHIVDGKIVQISDRNCANVVQVVEDFLRTGKISTAEISEAQNYHILEEIYKSKFLTYNFSTLNKVIKDGERGILLCERGYGKLSHVINIIKKDGKLIFKDGQVYSQEMNLLREFKTFKYLKTH